MSPYRLAAHLTSAFAIYATLVWTTLSISHPTPILAQLANAATAASAAAGPVITSAGSQAVAAGAALLRSRALPVAALVGITAISGVW